MPSLELTRLNGFNRGKKQSFPDAELLVGTDAACSFRCDPTWDKTVSPQHARLSWQGRDLWVEDLGSRDGTWLSGRRVQKEKLTPGVVLEFGRGGPSVKIEWTPEPAPVAGPARAPAGSLPPVVAQPAPAVVRAPAPERARPAATSGKPAKPNGAPVWVYAVAVMLVLGVGALLAWRLQRSGGNADERLAAVAHEKEAAVGVVVIVHPSLDGGQPTPCATAWAVATRVFATNSHVTEMVQQVLEKGGSAFVVLNRHPDRRIRILNTKTHGRYDQKELSFEGKAPAVPPYDVGLLHTDESAPVFFKLASKSELERVDSGYRVAYLGFPMEGMAGGGVDARNPVATMQSGIVTSSTDYWLAKAPYEKRLLIQHNLGAAGGASGSPVFNADGEVVAVLSAGNIIGSVSLAAGEEKITRAPSGVMVNFAQRVDLLGQLDPALAVK